MDSPQNSEVGAEPTRLGRSFLWMAWTGVVGIASSVLVWIFLARLRDIEDVGRFAIVMGLYALFFNFNSLGLMTYLVNELSRRGPNAAREFISSSGVFLSLSSVICAVVMCGSALIVSGSSEVVFSAFVLSLSLLPSNVITVSEAVAISCGRLRFIAAISTMENILKTIIPLGLILAGYNIVAICVSFTLIRVVAMVVHLVANKVRADQFRFCWKEFQTLAKVSPTFAGTGVMAALNWQAPLFMLAYFSSEAQSAEFGAASRFLMPVSILLGGYVNAVQPSLARHIAQAPQASGTYFSKLAGYPLSIAFVAAVGSMFLSEQVLVLLFGEPYATAAPTLKTLVMSIIPFCLIMVASRGLVATGLQRIDLLANVVGFITCVCAGLIAIPRYGAVGAAIAQLACFSIMGVIEVAVLSRKLGGLGIIRRAAWSSASIASIYLLLESLTL